MSDQGARDKKLPATWPYSAQLPQRYAHNYSRYVALGGRVDLEDDVRGFVGQDKGLRGDMARFYAFCLVLDQLTKEGLRGDLAELGVYKGNTATLLARIARRLGRTAYLLDTYEGFNAADFRGIDARQKMSFTDTSLEAVRALVGEDHVKYVKGYFPDTASQLPADGRYCLVHIDCDLHRPMLSALDYFYDRMVPGGFLIMHDYSSLHWGGAEQAVDEFFADKPESVVPMPDSAGSAMVRKSKRPDRYANWFVERRHAQLAGGWLKAANNGMREFLGSGWSSPEKWGVWGLGEMHELQLFLASPPAHDLQLEAEVGVVLVGARATLDVDVLVGGQVLATWHFARGKNQAVRSVRIPAALAAAAAASGRHPVVLVEFHPGSSVPPSKLDPAASDARPLGLGLIGVRLQSAGP